MKLQHTCFCEIGVHDYKTYEHFTKRRWVQSRYVRTRIQNTKTECVSSDERSPIHYLAMPMTEISKAGGTNFRLGGGHTIIRDKPRVPTSKSRFLTGLRALIFQPLFLSMKKQQTKKKTLANKGSVFRLS